MLIETASFGIFVPELLALAAGVAGVSAALALYSEFVLSPPDMSAFTDTEAQEEARCYAYCELRGATPEHTAWRNVWYPNPLTGNAEVIAAAVYVFASSEDFFMEFLKMLHAVTELEDDGVLPCPCDCPEDTWYQLISLSEVLPEYISVVDGNWVLDVGINPVDKMLDAGRYYRTAAINLTLPASRKVTKVKIQFMRYFGTWYNSSTGCDHIICYPSVDTFTRLQKYAPAGDSVSWECVPNDALMTGNHFRVSCCRDTHVHYTGSMRLQYLELWGEGDNPFT